jgi:DNA-binding NtrC family response regulator
MNGTQLLTAMKDTTPRMRKIIVTGYPDVKNAIESVSRGADGYLTKPVKMNELQETVKVHLLKRREEKAYGELKIIELIQTRLKKQETEELGS